MFSELGTMIPLSVYRFVFFERLTCYLYHGCIDPARTSLLEIIYWICNRTDQLYEIK
jgi:hypothetical protein